MKKIGIISDSHKKVGRTIKAINHLREQGAEFFIHAGDVVKQEVLDYLEGLPQNYVAVFGNNDRHLIEVAGQYNLVKEPYYFKFSEHTFKLMHLPYYMSADTDIIIYGHTHIFHTEMTEGRLFLNPGEVCARDSYISSAMLLEIDDDAYRVHHYMRKVKAKEWTVQTKIYARSPRG